MTTNEQPCGFGEFLSSSRHEKGLSLEQISVQTKIPVSKLKELENEDLDKLPAAVFVKGFVKAYAAAVGVDAMEAIQLFERCIQARLQSGVSTSVEPPKKVSSLRSKLILSFVILALLVFAFVRYGPNLKFGFNDSTLTVPANVQPTEQGPSTAPISRGETMNKAPATEEKTTESKLETSPTDVQPPDSITTNDHDTTTTTSTDYQEHNIDSSKDITDMSPAEIVRTESENAPIFKSDSDIITEKESALTESSFRSNPQNELNDNSLENHSSSEKLFPEVTANPEDLNTLSVVAIEKNLAKIHH